MASKKDNAFDSWDDFDDFDDLEMNGGYGDFKSTTKKGKAREAITALSGGLVSGVKDSLFSRNFHQTVVKAALPKEYSSALDKSLEVKDGIEDLYDAARKEVETSNDKLTKGVKPIVDKYGDKLPKRMARPLRKWTSGVKSSSDWSTENKDELETVAALNDIFSKREQTKSAKNTNMQSMIQTGIAQTNVSLTSQMLANQNRMLSYQDQIDMKWKRKTLELQYKTLFVQRKQLDISEQSLAYSKEALDAIVANTGLPDAVKINKMELASRIMSEKIYGSAISHFSTLPSNLLQNSVKNLKSKMKDSGGAFREAIDEALGYYEEAVDGSDQLEDQGTLDRINMGGDLAGGPLANYIGKKLGKKFNDRYGESDGVKRGADVLSSTMSRLPRMFGDMVKKGDTGNAFLDMMLELTDMSGQVASKNGVVSLNTKDKLDSQVYFDLLTKKSITEIIPGYLARIHHEIRTFRTGDDSQSMISYDLDKNVFSTDKDIAKSLKDKVLSGNAKRTLDETHKELIDKLGLDEFNKKNPEIKDAFLKRFNLASVNNNDFTLKTLLEEDNTDLTEEQREVYAKFVERKFGITMQDPDYDDRGISGKIRDGLAGTNAQAASAQRSISGSLEKFQGNIANPSMILNEFARTGQLQYAIATGIVDEVGGTYSVNFEKYFAALKDIEAAAEEDEKEEEKTTATKKYADLKAAQVKKLIDDAKKKWTGEEDPSPGRIRIIREGEEEDEEPLTDPDTISEIKAIVNKFQNTFNEENLSRLDEKYGVNDKIISAVEYAREATGKATPDRGQLEELYSSSKQFRDMVKVGIAAKTGTTVDLVNEKLGALTQSETATNLKQKADSHTAKASAMIEDISQKAKDAKDTAMGADGSIGKAKAKANALKESTLGTDGTVDKAKAKLNEKANELKESKAGVKAGELKDSATKAKNKAQDKVFGRADYAKVETAADRFLDENGINDSDGSVRESFVKTYIDNNFEGSKAWAGYQKIKAKGNTVANAAKDLAKNAKATGVNSNVKSAMSILFELTKYAGTAGALLTKPHREALKLIPWGLKKILGTLVEKVNFSHIEHALWLPGEEEPRLLKSGLMNGRYINGKGKVVERPKDLIGDIYDAMQTPAQLVMSKSEYKKGLFDSTGKLIYKPPGIIGKVAGLAAGLTKKLAKVAGKLTMGYLKVTTKPASWLINNILREKRIDPKLHAELVQLGLTEQTNKKLDELTETIKTKDDKKFNDKDGDGTRDGSAEDIIAKRKAKREGDDSEEGKKKGIFGRLRDKMKKKKKDGDDDDDEGGGGIMGMLGKGKGLGRLLGLAKNPYVMGALAAVGIGGYEAVMDKSKSADPEDMANLVLPEDLKDSLLARIGVRVGDMLVDKIALGTVRTAAKAAVKTGELADRLNKWSIRKGNQAHDGIKKKLNEIPGKVSGYLFGDKAKKIVDAFMNADNILPLFRFRMAQYGFKYNDKQSVEAVLKMEDDIIQTMSIATDTAPARIADSITVEQSAAYFDVSINNEDALTEWIAWFGNRFRPVFLSVVTVMQRLGYDSKKLHEADSLMGKKDKTALLSKSNFNRAGENPYDVNVHPLTTESKLAFGSADAVKSVFNEQISVIEAMPEDKEALKKEQDRAAKQQTKKKASAMDRHENTTPNKRFDPYAQIDKLNTKNIIKGGRKAIGLNEVPDTAINGKPTVAPAAGGGGKFGGAGAGATTAAAGAAGAAGVAGATGATGAAAATPNNGVVGNFLTGLGGMFVSQAHASTFIPEMQYGGATAPMGLAAAKGTLTAVAVANKADGSSATGISDKPVNAARHARKIAKSPSGLAARHLRAALQAAGYSFEAPSAASDYPAKALPDMGFIKVTDTGVYNVGDLVVFGSNKNHPFGHIQIYDGANWISDHVQDTFNPFDDMTLKHTLWRDADFIQNGTMQPAGVKKGAKDSEAVRKSEKILEDLKAPTAAALAAEKGKGAGPTKDDLKGPSVLSQMKDSFSAGMSNIANSSFGQAVSTGFNNATAGISNFVASMTGGQKKWQMCVYLAFKNAGFSEQQARIMTAEIGRENSYNPKFMFAGHADPHSGSNLGMLSWQKSRKTNLIAFLKKAGALDSAGNIKPSQEALNAQAKFIMWEMTNTEKSAGSKFLPHPNISYKDGTWVVGKFYIRWRIDKAPFAAPGAANRDAFYNMLLKQLNAKDGDSGTATAPPTTASSARDGVSAASLATGMGPIKGKDANTANAALLGGIMPQSKFPVGKVKPGDVLPNYTGVVNDAEAPVGKPAGGATPWMPIALSQLGINETHNTAITNGYHAIGARQTKWDSRSVPWCASFVGWVLNKAGLKHPITARARDYIDFGKKLGKEKIPYGAIMVMKIGSGNHVCFCHEDKGTSVVMLGGNQSSKAKGDQRNGGEVTLSTISKSCVVQVVYPTDFTPGNGAAAGGQYGSAGGGSASSGSAAAPYNPVTMKYNDYKGLDDKIADKWKSSSNAAPVYTKDGKAVAIGSKSDTVTPDSKEPTSNKSTTIAKNVVQAVSVKPETLAKDTISNFTPATDAKVGKDIEQQAQKLVEHKVTKNLTQRMSQVAAEKNTEQLTESTAILKQSLDTQRRMLDRLNSMDKHLNDMARGYKTSEVVESSSNSKVDATAPKSKPQYKVDRPGRNEPMSMSKMI